MKRHLLHLFILLHNKNISWAYPEFWLHQCLIDWLRVSLTSQSGVWESVLGPSGHHAFPCPFLMIWKFKFKSNSANIIPMVFYFAFCWCYKYRDQKAIWRRKDIFQFAAYSPSSSRRATTERKLEQKLKHRPWGTLFTGSLLMPCSTSFLIQSRVTCLGVALFAVGRALPPQLLIMKMLISLPIGQSVGSKFFNWHSLFLGGYSCTKITEMYQHTWTFLGQEKKAGNLSWVCCDIVNLLLTNNWHAYP